MINSLASYSRWVTASGLQRGDYVLFEGLRGVILHFCLYVCSLRCNQEPVLAMDMIVGTRVEPFSISLNITVRR